MPLTRRRRRRRRGFHDELEFWADYLATRGGAWTGSYARRLDPGAQVDDPLLRECIATVPGTTVTILDVGAGPLTSVGRAYPGKRIELVAVDPLADRYDELLREHGVTPPVRTREGAAEELTRLFPEPRFDIAYARNSLDHGDDPAKAVESMLSVVRTGGFVVLRHYENEGEDGGYLGLHQWNFTEREDRLLVWRRGEPTHDLSALLAGAARVDVKRTAVMGGRENAWICAVIRKRG
jgi:SAM-dependent methyltransferase